MVWFFGVVSLAIAFTALSLAGAADSKVRKLEERIELLEKN